MYAGLDAARSLRLHSLVVVGDGRGSVGRVAGGRQ